MARSDTMTPEQRKRLHAPMTVSQAAKCAALFDAWVVIAKRRDRAVGCSENGAFDDELERIFSEVRTAGVLPQFLEMMGDYNG